jgi:soluble lytic murein transglycosylase-like protein
MQTDLYGSLRSDAMSGSRWVGAVLGIVGFIGAGAAQAALYVYQLPDGSRVVTDHALSNAQYRLIRTGETPRDIARLVAHQNPQLFRADPTAYDRLIQRVAAEHSVDFALVKAVMHAESAFNPYAKSDKGALGLMQVMPATARRYGVEELHDPTQNVVAGVKHLKYLLATFKNKRNLALAAYNAGENAVLRHHGIPPYPETQDYVRKVMKYHREYSRTS